jgi:hypothetical protein
VPGPALNTICFEETIIGDPGEDTVLAYFLLGLDLDSQVEFDLLLNEIDQFSLLFYRPDAPPGMFVTSPITDTPACIRRRRSALPRVRTTVELCKLPLQSSEVAGVAAAELPDDQTCHDLGMRSRRVIDLPSLADR